MKIECEDYKIDYIRYDIESCQYNATATNDYGNELYIVGLTLEELISSFVNCVINRISDYIVKTDGIYFTCFSCGKCHDSKDIPLEIFCAKDQSVKCDCGWYIVSKSGKVMMGSFKCDVLPPKIKNPDEEGKINERR